MLSLLRNWLLDPAALLFIASIFVGFILVKSSRNRLRRKSTGSKSAAGRFLLNRRNIVSFRAVIIMCVWFFMFAITSSPILVNPLVNMLEQQHASAESCAVGSHVVLLSGGVSSRARTHDQFEKMSYGTFKRANEAYKIMSREPESTLIVSGGELFRVTEAQVIGNYLEALGVSKDRMILESRSKNTHENAVRVAAILAEEDVVGPVRLVSSAMHMPRAMGSFNMALKDTDVNLCPVSVDFLGITQRIWYAVMPQVTALVKFDILIHEVVGLVVYRLKGWL